MKKILNYCLFLLILMVFSLSSVNAEEISIKSLPKEFASDDIKYSIDSFEIKVYDASNNADGNSKYFTDKQVLYTIPITGDDLTINPVITKSKLYEVPATFVKLNLSIDNSKIIQLVKEKIPNTTDDATYIFEVVANYKINEVPNEYKYYAHLNLFDLMLSIFGNSNVDALKNITLNNTTTQIINIGGIIRENGKEETYYGNSVNEKGEDVSTASGAMLDYAVLSKKEPIISSENDTTDSYIFMLHDMDNIEKVLSDYQKSFKENKDEFINNDDDNKDNSQQVKVDDTGINISIVGYGIGAFIMILGITVIVNTIWVNKKNS